MSPFCAASGFFVEVVAAVPRDRYDEPWSDAWTVLDLIAHGNRANVLPVEYYERPVPRAGREYASPENVARRARLAVVDLGDDPVAVVRRASQRAIVMVRSAPNDARVGTPFGEQALDVYLRSRTAELVLHALDLDPDAEAPREALEECATFLASRATDSGHGLVVVRALSGRGSLPPTFSVY